VALWDQFFMTRLARLDARGVLHRVIIRGIERRKIFKYNKDREDLLARSGQLLSETNTACHALSVLSNHAHFLFRTGESGLSTLMRTFLTGYKVRGGEQIAKEKKIVLRYDMFIYRWTFS
jgi:REP element-mobilizing transposase RayT